MPLTKQQQLEALRHAMRAEFDVIFSMNDTKQDTLGRFIERYPARMQRLQERCDALVGVHTCSAS
jgi:hypothetical protein